MHEGNNFWIMKKVTCPEILNISKDLCDIWADVVEMQFQ